MKSKPNSRAKMFKRTPICEACGEDEAISFSLIRFPEETQERWQFTCICTDQRESYGIMLEDFFRCPSSTVDWLAHMHSKKWVDWNDFMDMVKRFRAATDSFQCLSSEPR